MLVLDEVISYSGEAVAEVGMFCGLIAYICPGCDVCFCGVFVCTKCSLGFC